MADFKPLGPNSQGSATPVLYINADATRNELMDAADWRLGAVKDLLTLLSAYQADDCNPRDVARASRGLQLLVEDADSLYQAARQAA